MSGITVLLPNNLGDVIMALPVLDAVKKANPACRTTFLVENGYEGGLVHNALCDRIVTINRRSIKDCFCSTRWREGVETLRALMDEVEGEDMLVNLSQHPYLSYMVAVVNASDCRGRRFLREGNHALPDLWSQYLYTIPFARRYNSLHATDVYCRIAGVRSGTDNKLIVPTDRERASCASYFAEHDFPIDTPIVVLQPGVAWPSKRWPARSFISLGKKLIADGYRIVITGAPAERELAVRIAGELGARCLNSAGDLSFRESIVLLTVAKVVVTGDTAIMHAAAAVGTKVIALFGPTSPVETGPYGSGHTILCGKCPHRPCFRTTCPDGGCMQSIPPEVVYGIVGSMQPETVGNVDRFTTLNSDGEYRLLPEESAPASYTDASGAALTRRAFDHSCSGVETESNSPELLETRQFIHQCLQMEDVLSLVKGGGDTSGLGRFELLRRQAAQIGGIADFWSALLNIRLNSVPLINPVAGIEGSMAACRTTREQIEAALLP